ncbi:MAG: hypothetical protein ABIQ16_11500 [Polyangiaceae bacterium]
MVGLLLFSVRRPASRRNVAEERTPSPGPPHVLEAKAPFRYFDAHNDASSVAVTEVMDLSGAAGVKSIAILTDRVTK